MKKILILVKYKKITITIHYRQNKNHFITSCFNLFFIFYLKYNNYYYYYNYFYYLTYLPIYSKINLFEDNIRTSFSHRIGSNPKH